MRLLHTADLHLDTPFAWAPHAVAARRRQAIRDTLRAICRLAIDRKVDAVTIAGDLYEQERFTPDTAAFLKATLADLHPLPVLIAPGNHDWFGPSSIYATNRWSPNVHIFASDRLEPHRLGDLTIWGAAHRARANTDDFLHAFRATAAGPNIGLFHASERGSFGQQESGKQPHATFSAYEIAAAGLDHALLGHFHTPVDGADYTYPGNPEPLTFGETGPRGAVLVEVQPDGSVSRERIAVAQTPIADIDIEVSGSASAQDVIEKVTATLASQRGLARVSISGEVPPTLALDPVLLQQATTTMEYVQFRTAGLRPAYDLEAIRTEQTVRGQFVRDVESAPLEAEERRRVLITGLRALGGRADLEVAG